MGDSQDQGVSPSSRRAFLKAVAAALGAGAGLTDLPWLSPLRAEPVGRAVSDRVRIGMIGIGSRGGLLMDNLLQTPGVEVAAVCDVYPAHLQRALAATGGKAKAYGDYRALLDQPDIDAVVIATPLYLHAPMSLAALSAGKSVFCEKSLALTIDECKAVARAASASPHVFQIGHQRLFDLRFLTALDHMRAGALGPITQIRAYWHRNLSWRRPSSSA
jgi:predicted dehydrogenase